MHDVSREPNPETRSVRGVLASCEPMKPRDTDERSRRATDVTRLTFPVQIVIYIVSATIAGTVAVWAANSGQNQRFDEQSQKTDKLSASMTLLVEKLATQQLLKEQESKLAEERLSNMRESMRKMEARIEMIQIQQAARDKEINDSLVQLKSRR